MNLDLPSLRDLVAEYYSFQFVRSVIFESSGMSVIAIV